MTASTRRIRDLFSRPADQTDTKMQALRATQALGTLSERELMAAATNLDEVTVPSGKVMIREGQRNDTLWLVIEGSVEVTVRGRLLRKDGPGTVLGAPSMLDGRDAGVTVVAKEPVRALVAFRQQFDSLLMNSKIEESLWQRSGRRVRGDFLRLISEFGKAS